MIARLTARLQQHAVAMLAIALAVALCWLLARWTWVFLAPAVPLASVAKPAVTDSIDPIIGARLFGGAGRDMPAGQAQAATSLNLKLRGVFAAGGPAGATAVINAGARDDAFRVGDAVLPGVLLEAVFPDHVLLRRQGALERLNLEEKGQAANLISLFPGPTLGAEKKGKHAAPGPLLH